MAANARCGSRQIRARDSLERPMAAAMIKSTLLFCAFEFAHRSLRHRQ
jgi:hypothetical protein